MELAAHEVNTEFSLQRHTEHCAADLASVPKKPAGEKQRERER